MAIVDHRISQEKKDSVICALMFSILKKVVFFLEKEGEDYAG